MDLDKTLRELYYRKEKLDTAIAELEELQRNPAVYPVLPKPAEKRGRKSMNSQERQEVAERMRKYWAGRRSQRKP